MIENDRKLLEDEIDQMLNQWIHSSIIRAKLKALVLDWGNEVCDHCK